MVSARARALADLLDAWDEEVEPPSSLEALIRQAEPPAADTMLEHMKAAARRDLGDVPRAMAALPDLSPEEVRRLARRFGWTVRVLADWEPLQHRSGLVIEAALASAAAWDEAGSFWEVLRSRLGDRLKTIAALEVVARNRKPEARIPDDAPIWEREHLDGLQEAERAGDWAKLGERAHAFQQLPVLDLCAAQAVRGLASLDWLRLIRIADSIESWLHGHMLLSPLALADAFRVATASTSGHVRFAALERVVRRERRTALSSEETTALRNLLIVLAGDEDGWPRWLALCNRYPVRCPHMQEALGRALACRRDGALRDYVDSISLDTSTGNGRDCVTRCLSVFRARARLPRRRVLWLRAYERWRAWDFGRDEGRELTEIGRSALDYGAVGWLIEGGVGEEFPDPEQAFEHDLRALDMHWHASLSAAISDFFRLVSRHQVLAHAKGRSVDDAEWLPGPGIHVPIAAADTFTQRRFRWVSR